jgi:hypothetical protein
MIFQVEALASPPQSKITREDVEAIDRAVEITLDEMSPDERQAFYRKVEINVVSEIKSAALACGTTVTFTDEPRFEDRSVLITPSATPEQIACVRARYPFAKSGR